MKKIIFLLAVAVISATFISSCKKGEDDPFISFRSRDSRIIGTWTLKSQTYTDTRQTVTKTTNNVNSDVDNTDEKTTETYTFDGTTYTEKTTDDNKDNNTTTSYDYVNNKFTTSSSETKDVQTTTDTYTYSVEVEIKDDHTYKATYTKTELTHKTSNSYTYGGNTTTTETDTSYSPQNTKTWTEEGNWFWLDANDDKIYIEAGPLSGVLKKLSNKEVIIEYINKNSTDKTDYNQSLLFTYDDTNDPYKTKSGVETEKRTDSHESSDLATWEAKK